MTPEDVVAWQGAIHISIAASDFGGEGPKLVFKEVVLFV